MEQLNYERAKRALFQIPPDFSAFEELSISAEKATELAFEYAEACWDEGISFEDND